MTSTEAATARHRLILSIVSHGQGDLVARLLDDLAGRIDASVHVIVTINVPEPEGFLDGRPFPVQVIRNREPKGFGANHNQAFGATRSLFFAVVNPDIRLPRFDIDVLLRSFDDAAIAALSPLVRALDGTVEDNARRFPTPARIGLRVARRLAGLRNDSDYRLEGALTPVDWVAGMFVVFRSDVFQRIGGFDERYFMYLEDADICRRIGVVGHRAVVDAHSEVVHAARRATLRRWKHFRWHATSMTRFFVDTLSRRALRDQAARTSEVAK